jgi:hypothetical protein
VTARLFSPKLFRLSTGIILALCGLYFLSVVSAYFVFDLSHNPLHNASDWWYGIEENPAFISRILPIGLLVLILYFVILPIVFAAGSVVGLNLWRRWNQLTQRQRIIGIVAIGAILFLLLLAVFTPAWDIGSLWFYD